MTARQPVLLDLYCCQGAASEGYRRSGFAVRGIDIDPQPRYPFGFIQASALDCDPEWVARNFDAVHASPPCQAYSNAQKLQGNTHPELIAPTRALLEATGLPFVIENVEAAAPELRNPVTLCGAAFGLHTYRHRVFEFGGGFSMPQPEHAPHVARTVKMGRPLAEGDFYHAVGNFTNVDYVRRDMGVPWMNRNGIRECIPPAYTEHVGRALYAHLTKEIAA